MKKNNQQNTIIKDLLWRSTAKKYDAGKKISNDDLETILESLRLTASSINSQPWKFIVLESPEAKQRMYHTFGKKYPFNRPHVVESSHVILLAHNPNYSKQDYVKIVDQEIKDGRVLPEERENTLKKYFFAEINTDNQGYNGHWTKAQLYIALGNLFHTLARLKIDGTAMEGIDIEKVNKEFSKELNGYQCDVAVAIGYRHKDDYNAKLPKSRLPKEAIIKII